MKVWLAIYPKKIVKALIKFDNFPDYIEIGFFYFTRRDHKRIKISLYNIRNYTLFYNTFHSFPKDYKYSFSRGLYLEGDVIRNQEVRKLVYKRFGIKRRK